MSNAENVLKTIKDQVHVIIVYALEISLGDNIYVIFIVMITHIFISLFIFAVYLLPRDIIMSSLGICGEAKAFLLCLRPSCRKSSHSL